MNLSPMSLASAAFILTTNIPARHGRINAAWQDQKGNIHDLDFVLEAGGSEEIVGRPKAFIEVAYRRYTKHSRNKAQEIHGAIIPLAETFAMDRPFLGVVLAGVFTDGSVTQLRSHGFGVLFFPFASIVTAFQTAGIDANFDESSSDRSVKQKVAACTKLSDAKWSRIISRLRHLHHAELDAFLIQLDSCLTRAIQNVFVLGLHGRAHEAPTLDDAIQYIRNYDETSIVSLFRKFELNIRYTNGDEVRATFSSRLETIGFLEGLRAMPHPDRKCRILVV